MWIEAALDRLQALQAGGAWGYKPGGALWSEPTALANLALAAHGRPGAAEVLLRAQDERGAFGIAEDRRAPGWPTPLAILTLTVLGTHPRERDRAVEWLLQTQGRVGKDPEAIMGHDTALVGWPWVEETHSWLEPTALAIMALRRAARADHPRVKDGVRLIRDRALPTKGGWNYGNTIVFGSELRPQPAPTGMALVALAGTEADAVVERACAYLERTLPSVRAPMSLGWGLLGLSAWKRRPSAAGDWLSEAFSKASARTDDLVPHLSLLLLAASERSLVLFGAP